MPVIKPAMSRSMFNLVFTSGSSDSAEQPADYSARSNAELPASYIPDAESTTAVRGSDNADLHRIYRLKCWCANIERIFRQPLWKQDRHSTAEQPATLFRSFVSSAAQCTSDNTLARFPCAQLPYDTLLLIVRFLGAHNLETIWECSECNPYWYNWYCEQCEMGNRYLYWSHTKHFGYCGVTCGCCRTARNGSGCGACEELKHLKRTCHTMRDLLKTYSGT